MNVGLFFSCAISMGATGVALAQGFSNLGFESASVGPTAANGFGTDVSATEGFPRWKAYIGDSEVSTVWHNNLSLGSPAVAIVGPNWGTSQGIIEGNFTALLTAGASDAVLGQTGLVPIDAEAILFKARPGNGALTVSMAGSLVPVVPLALNNGVVEYGADISAWKGAISELKFTAVPIDPISPTLNLWYLDSIKFSNQLIPEPPGFALLTLGAGALCLVISLKRRQR